MAFSRNFPKVLTAVAVFIGAVASLIGALYTAGVIGKKDIAQESMPAPNVFISVLSPADGNIVSHGGGRIFPIKIENGEISPFINWRIFKHIFFLL